MSAPTTLQGFPLSPLQEELWRLGEDAAPPVTQAVIAVEGPSAAVEVAADDLSAALAAVVERHEILRTHFRSLRETRTPLQVIEDEAPPRIEDEDLAALDEPAREARIRAALAEERETPFDLSDGAPLRVRRLRLGPASWRLLLTAPALAVDAPSAALLVGELARAWAARTGAGAADASEPMQYADVAAWLQELAGSDAGREARDHWRREAERAAEDPGPPFERPPGTEGTDTEPCRGAVPVPLEAGVAGRLARIAGAAGAEGWRSVLLAAWQTLLWRLGGGGAAAVRVALDGRRYEELREAVGPLARHLPLVARPEPGESFRDRVRDAGDRLAEAARRQEYFEAGSAVEGAGAEGDTLVAGFELVEGASAEAGGAAFRLAWVEARAGRLPVALVGRLDGGTPSLAIEHDTRRLAARDAATLAGSLAALLADAANDPDRPLVRLDLLGAEARSRLLASADAAPEPAATVHELFERQARETPERTALREGERSLTYAELAARVHQLAHLLRRRGVVPGTLVAVTGARTLETVVSVLAVLEAGGAYVPLESDQPRVRLLQVLEDAEPGLLLRTAGGGAGPIEPPEGLAELRVSLDDWPAADESAEPMAPSAGPDDLAYVLFTSGTTGRPKGVMVPHRGVVAYLGWCARAYGMAELGEREGAGAPVHSPLGFDLTVTSLFAPLVTGRPARLLPEAPGVERLAAAVREDGETGLVKLTPAHLEMLSAELADRGPVGEVRALVIGGEALRAETLAFWRERSPATRLFNEYGPTETVVGCCVHEVGPDDPAEGPVAIGRAIDGAALYVLDPRLEPVPRGVAGELCVAGAGVARGYLARPAVTAERFLPDPYGGTPGARMYRTGDLVRHRPDGALVYLGRRDGQVKVRGYRIELGDVESALAGHPGVAEAAVVAVGEDGAGRRLVAFFVPAGGAAPSESALAAHLRERLPEWMLPTAFHPKAGLPLTGNGKVDRAALAEGAADAPRGGEVAPRTPTEELVADVWREVLGVERLGVHDDFLALGGHSLSATRVLTRLRRIFELELPFRLLMEASTVARVAERIDSDRSAGRRLELPPIEPVDRSVPPPLGLAQKRIWFLDRISPGSPVYNVPGALHLAGALDADALRRALAEVVRRHEPLRTSFRVEAGQPVQVIAPPGPGPELPVVDLGAMPEDERREAARARVTEEVRRPFDLERDPVLRALLLRLADDEHLLVLTVHHVVFDGWSAGILVGEIGALYAETIDGRPASLPELPVQYADFASWQREWLEGEALEDLLGFWRDQLAGPLPVLELPMDRPRPAVLGTRGGVSAFALPRDLTASIQALGRRRGATLFMTALTVFESWLTRVTGQDELVVGTPVAGRDRVETEGMIGLLINTLALRTDLSGDPTFDEGLRRVREVALAAHAHREMPFERLVQELQPDRDASRTPIFQVLFALQNSPVQPLSLRELEITPVDVHTGTAKLDLSLAMSEIDGVLGGSIEYPTDLFDAATIDRMAGQLRALFEAAAEDPERRLSALSLLTPGEERQLFHEWNTGRERRTRRSDGDGLYARFARRADNAPDAVAVVAGDLRLSYGELARRAGALAGRLRALGVGPESRVGICLERSERLLVALLAVIEAGGAYVPLDPVYPADRVAFMLEDSGAGLVITETVLADRFASRSEGTQVLDLDAPEEDGDAGALPASGLAGAGAGGGRAAYVIYTSGSTGRPKGVLVSHDNVLRLFDSTFDRFAFAPDDGWTLFHSFAFDFSVWEIWGALLYGGRVVVVPYAVSRAPEAFHELVVKERVTFLNQTPSAFRSLTRVAAADEGEETPLRCVVFGGEALEFGKLRPWTDRFGTERPKLVNMYGITETTVHVTYREVEADDLDGPVASAVGRAIPDLSIRLLDAAGRPAPVGVPGEIHVGGDGLARGYLGRPGLTASRFVPDPFAGGGDDPGARLYRAGDLARYRPDGDLEFLGRIDHQVKIRGFRIELGEIEVALAAHPGLAEVVVAGHDGGEETPGETRLVAWVVPSAEPAPTVEELRELLARVLPEYMVPAVFVPMPALPVTPSGKVDRRALPAPGAERLATGTDYRPPTTELERVLTEIWAEVLGVERVGIDDSFFGLGGDSMRTLQVVGLAKERGLVMELLDVYGFQTVRELAAHLEEAGVTAQAAPAPEAEDDDAMLAELLAELDDLSDEEVESRLAGETPAGEETAV